MLEEGYAGLAVGLKILNDMAENHWDCLFPPAKRMRARQTAYVWLAEKVALLVAKKAPQSNEFEFSIAAADLLKQLDNTLVEKMGDQAPLLTELSRPLKNHRQMAQAELEKISRHQRLKLKPFQSSSRSQLSRLLPPLHRHQAALQRLCNR